METTAIVRGVRLSAQKGRLVADLVRGKPVDAIANAEHNDGADVDDLFVKKIYVEKATTLRRFGARAKGRGTRIGKQTAHIFVTVGDK